MTAALDGILRTWNWSQPFVGELKSSSIGSPSIVQLSPNGRWLLLKGTRGAASFCELSNRKLSLVSLADSSDTVNGTFGPDGKLLVLTRKDGALDLWDIAKQPTKIKGQSGNGPVEDVNVSPDGQTFVTANWDGTARVYSVSGGQTLGFCRMETV